MTDDARVLAFASEIFPLYRRAHDEYIGFCERAAKVLLLDVGELDIRDFELTAARVEGTMNELQVVVRRTWEAKKKLDEGLANVQRLKEVEGRQRADTGLSEPTPRTEDTQEMAG